MVPQQTAARTALLTSVPVRFLYAVVIFSSLVQALLRHDGAIVFEACVSRLSSPRVAENQAGPGICPSLLLHDAPSLEAVKSFLHRFLVYA